MAPRQVLWSMWRGDVTQHLSRKSRDPRLSSREKKSEFQIYIKVKWRLEWNYVKEEVKIVAIVVIRWEAEVNINWSHLKASDTRNLVTHQ